MHEGQKKNNELLEEELERERMKAKGGEVGGDMDIMKRQLENKDRQL